MNIKVQVEEIRNLMTEALVLRGITGEEAAFIIEDYIEAEIEGHGTHGLSKFLVIDAGIAQRKGQMQVTKQEGCYAGIDGNRELGHVVALHAADLTIKLAKEHGVGLTVFHNVSRYSRITPYARRIAEAGLIGMLANNGGPMCVAPFGGKEPILGTNPICFSFPSTGTNPYIFDFSTAQKVWGEIRQAIIQKRQVAPNAFLDKTGAFTRNPEKVVAGIPFGGAKGYALSFALEVMTGALIGTKMGTKSRDEYDLGYLFLAFSTEMFTDLETFKEEMDELADSVRNCEPIQPGGQVFVPGEIFADRKYSDRNCADMELELEIYQRLKRMSNSLDGGLENNKLLN